MTVPPGRNAGLSAASLQGCARLGAGSSGRVGGSRTGTISPSNRPESMARAERRCVRTRERILVFPGDPVALATFSAVSPMARGELRPSRVQVTPAERGVPHVRLPPGMPVGPRTRPGAATSTRPRPLEDSRHPRATLAGARRPPEPDAHSRLTVTPGTSTGRPARSTPSGPRSGCPRPPGSRRPSRRRRSRPRRTPARSTAAAITLAGEVVGPHARKHAAVAPDGRAHRRQDRPRESRGER